MYVADAPTSTKRSSVIISACQRSTLRFSQQNHPNAYFWIPDPNAYFCRPCFRFFWNSCQNTDKCVGLWITVPSSDQFVSKHRWVCWTLDHYAKFWSVRVKTPISVLDSGSQSESLCKVLTSSCQNTDKCVGLWLTVWITVPTISEMVSGDLFCRELVLGRP